MTCQLYSHLSACFDEAEVTLALNSDHLCKIPTGILECSSITKIWKTFRQVSEVG